MSESRTPTRLKEREELLKLGRLPETHGATLARLKDMKHEDKVKQLKLLHK